MKFEIKEVSRLLMHSKFLRRQVARVGLRALVSLCVFGFITSCTNINLGRRAPSSVFIQGTANSGNSGAFHLDGMATDAVSPGTVYNFLGRDGEFDTFCGGTYGTCICIYSYQQNGVGTQTVEATSTYQESNMVRCPNSVPAGISSFTIKLKTGTTATQLTALESNEVVETLGAGGGIQDAAVFMDLTNELNYLPVKRYQCRKNEFIGSPFDSSILDPIQSQDPRVIYPFNYYTTNVGESLLAMQRNTKTQGWDCTLTSMPDYSLHWWANPYVFSMSTCTDAFCAGDGELIYPKTTIESGKIPVTNSSATGKRRSSFSLLKTAYGPFQIPVIGATAPFDYVSAYYSGSTVAGITLSPLGYAAKPIPNVSGTSSCPSTTIPSNARWVKLWSYRATDLTPPKKVIGSTASTVAPIACLTEDPKDMFDSCYFDVGPTPTPTPTPTPAPSPGPGNSYFKLNGLAAGKLASRIGLFSGTAAQASACYKVEYALNSTSSDNYDLFQPSTYAFGGSGPPADPTGAANSIKGYPWDLYRSVTAGVLTAASPAPSPYWPFTFQITPAAITPGQPSDSEVHSISINSPDGTNPGDNFSDFLFVVTDPSVSDSDMINMSAASNQYRPITYRSKQACPNDHRSACPVTGNEGSEVHWDINTKDVNNPNGGEVYPLCVLQFTD
jgi:hypothetical protein